MMHLCPDCQQPLELLMACGCRDYFCNQCQQLVSKGRVKRLASRPIDGQTPANQPSSSATGH
ncbi:zinc-ribbon domain-containing protein [Reinekea sp.]|uniref:YfgJ family double zinc ribbon protein n=1 Tax=Reinekea sp. TaxID=1970455 RepID=UPI0039C36154